jgi:flagellar hook-basal body complex protein FliE
MSRLIDSKEAFKRGAQYEEGGKVLPRAERKPEPSTDQLLLAVLGEIRNAVQASAKMMAAMPAGHDNGLAEQIVANQDAILALLSEIKKSGVLTAKKPAAKKWIFKIEKNDDGSMREVVAINTDG